MKDEYRELELLGKIVRVIDDGVAIFDPKTGHWENRRKFGTTGCWPAPRTGQTRAEKQEKIQESLEEFLEEPDLRKHWDRRAEKREAARQAVRALKYAWWHKITRLWRR